MKKVLENKSWSSHPNHSQLSDDSTFHERDYMFLTVLRGKHYCENLQLNIDLRFDKGPGQNSIPIVSSLFCHIKKAQIRPDKWSHKEKNKPSP